jgi:cytoskeletal protein RodZ
VSNPQFSPAPPAEPARPANRQLGERVRNLRLSRLPERRTPWGKIIGWPVALIIISIGGWWGYKQLVARTAGDEASTPSTAAADKPAEAPRSTTTLKPTTETPRSTTAAIPSAPAGEIALEAKG